MKRITPEKLRIKEAIVVEGRDDTAAVKRAAECLVIETHGFGIKKETWNLIEKAYVWLTPWHEKNPVFDNGILALDETLDNSHIPHYKVISPKKRNNQQNGHEEGELYVKADGEVYTIVYNTERRVCELVWEAFKGEIPQGYRVCHIDGDKQNNRLDNLKLVEE